MPLSSGTRLGAYEILTLIGSGGMGEVYRAKDTKLGRDVALKILPASFTNDPDRIARFRREAQVLASLNHPHIAQIYGFEEANGTQFLVIELVEGESLDKRIARGPMPFDEALGIARQIADALEAAHERGIIHRDLKPANIALTNDGAAKVLDFGLAKAVEGATSLDLTNSPTITTPAMMTGIGVILGTAAYMSPEQAKGRPADKRSDIWAFGCVLYELLTGRRAFEGEDVSDTLAAVLRGEPDWARIPPEVPPYVGLLIRHSLEKNRTARLPEIAAARFVLTYGAMLAGTAEPAAVAPPRTAPLWRRAMPVALTVVLTAASVSSAWWRFGPDVARPAVSRSTFLLGEGQQFTNPGRLLVGFSPDGTQIVYAANSRLYIRAMAETAARPITGSELPAQVTNPVFSPDGHWIAFYSGAGSEPGLMKIPVTGGTAIALCSAANPFGMSWDGSGIVFGQAGNKPGIFRVSANGGRVEQLVAVKPDEVAHGPQMLPDHETLLFTLGKRDGVDRSVPWDKAQVMAQSLRSGRRTTLIDGGSDARYVPSGHLVYAIAGVLYAIPFDVRRLQVTGGPAPVVEGVRRGRGDVTGTAQFSVSDTGSLIYVPGPISTSADQLVLVRLDRKGVVERLKLAPAMYESPRVSPDGKWLAVGIVDDREANIWVYDLAGTRANRRLTNGGRNRFPVWSPDSRRVAFQSDREGDEGLFWQLADGTGTAERLTKSDPDTSHAPESWSPQGSPLLFRVTKGPTYALWMLDVTSKKATPFGGVASSIFPNSVFSPDGRWVAYSARTQGQALPIYVQPFPATGSVFQIWPDAALHPMWSSDGKELFAEEAGGLSFVTITATPAFAFSRPVGSTRQFLGSGPFVPGAIDRLPDGQHFVALASAENQPEAPAPQIQIVLNWQEELKARVPAK